MDAIVQGKKRYEFRKAVFKDREIDRVYIYATSPVKRIIGSFAVGHIAKDSPERLWDRFKEHSGIDYPEFLSYFQGRDIGFAIEIDELDVFDPRGLDPDFTPPQSYYYLEGPPLPNC